MTENGQGMTKEGQDMTKEGAGREMDGQSETRTREIETKRNGKACFIGSFYYFCITKPKLFNHEVSC